MADMDQTNPNLWLGATVAKPTPAGFRNINYSDWCPMEVVEVKVDKNSADGIDISSGDHSNEPSLFELIKSSGKGSMFSICQIETMLGINYMDNPDLSDSDILPSLEDVP